MPLEDMGMRTCHECHALVPVEAVLCTACDAYLGRMTAMMGQGVREVPPEAPVPQARDPHAPVDWGVMSEPAPERTVNAMTWQEMPSGRLVGEVKHGAVEYRLEVTRNHWKLYELKVFPKYLLPVLLENGSHGSPGHGKEQVEAALERQLRKVLLPTADDTPNPIDR